MSSRPARPPPGVPPVKESASRAKVAPLLLVMVRTLLVALGSATGVVVTETPAMPLASISDFRLRETSFSESFAR
jgi:hypothetical protein